MVVKEVRKEGEKTFGRSSLVKKKNRSSRPDTWGRHLQHADQPGFGTKEGPPKTSTAMPTPSLLFPASYTVPKAQFPNLPVRVPWIEKMPILGPDS